jgi:hypothetical protein
MDILTPEQLAAIEQLVTGAVQGLHAQVKQVT